MIAPLWMMGAAGFAGRWWKMAVGAALAAGPFFLLGQCEGKKAEADKREAATAIANAELLKKDVDIREEVASQRRVDEINTQEMTEELTDAVADLPDAMPSARRVALACARLRQQSADPIPLPAVCGLDPRGEAAARAGSAGK